MAKRVNVDGPGDDPDEYWFECEDCEGTGTVNVPDGLMSPPASALSVPPAGA